MKSNVEKDGDKQNKQARGLKQLPAGHMSSQVKSCLRCKYTAIEHISINKA